MNHHDEAFFAQMRGCRDAYRRLADAIHAVMGPHDAVEHGAGIGMQTARLAELGWQIVGTDESEIAIAMREVGAPLVRFDLRSEGAFDGAAASCAICTETAEHIEADYADRIVEHVARAATKWIVWSAAQPGQAWPGHVNLQPPGYWIAKFAALGWEPDDDRTASLRREMWKTKAQHCYARDNFYVLRRTG